MLGHILLEGNLLWAYDYELEDKNPESKFAGLFSFMKPLHNHEGLIVLSDNQISINSDEQVSIALDSIDQLFLGFDELYPASSVRNWGAFWQPLRIEYSNTFIQTRKIYLVIGYNGIFAQNKIWYDTLKELLSQR